MFPFSNQADIHIHGARVFVEERHWDCDGFERTQRRIGAEQCPRCGLWWPCIEEPHMWVENEETNRKDAEGWWGGTICEECELLMIDQPDGLGEVFDLRG